ncbi:VWA domain-containing protein [Arundinibacter roseus]|uniref:VWA domain-containing protein n=1 Tax=Arundinibacter roseus TaxID=2070510 RepID=A0A4R4JUW7_9BACT|nr:VWA domain-containing protein [Arundinibacter roseus]TDB57329.1 VWA domain-containing protein [Arundinibacter roseus]
MRSELFLQSSPWFILLCLLVGSAYAFFLYKPEPTWSKNLNVLLAILRGTLVSVLCFLLLAPLVRTIQTTTDKAKVVFAIDNSLSASGVADKALPYIKEAQELLSANGYEVSVQTLTDETKIENLDSIRFTASTTNLAGMLGSIRSNFENQNLTDVILLSDGIVNQGIAPASATYPFRINTIAIGDTVLKQDIQIRNVTTNRVAYMGNEFPIQVDITANGLAGRSTVLLLKQGGRLIASQPIQVNRNDFFQSFTFTTSSNQKGVQHYTVELGAVAGEFTAKNNRREVYIDIIDGREKILMLGLAPHPDIKALRSIIEKNENFELDVRLLTTTPNLVDISEKAYDLIILHQLPDVSGLGAEFIRKLLSQNTPVFFILGNQSSVGAANSLHRTLQISSGSGQFDKVTGLFNSSFQLLNLDPQKLSILEKLPPLSVPFGEYRLSSGTEVVLYQRVGSVATTKPLLAIHTAGERKMAVLAGEGIWLWRQEEFALTESQAVIDELFQKVIQLLSVKEDKRKFRVYPVKAEFETGEQALFQTEVYNDIYEKIYGQEIQLNITDEKGVVQEYAYTHREENPRFAISGLAEGVYRYSASTTIKGNTERVNGQFVVRTTDLEAQNTTADFGMLRELSQRTGGQFFQPTTLESLTQKMIENRPPDRLDSTEQMAELIQLKWLFFLLLLLATIEWGLRKYSGSY